MFDFYLILLPALDYELGVEVKPRMRVGEKRVHHGDRRGSALRKASTRITGHLTRTAPCIHHFSIVTHQYSSQAHLRLLTFSMERYHREVKRFSILRQVTKNSSKSEPPKSPSPRSRICRSWPKHPSSSA